MIMQIQDMPGAVFVAICFIMMIIVIVFGGFVIPNI